MKLHWLQLKKPCVLEIREVKDYAGQPLVFRPPGLSRRCVTDEGLQHALVQRYLTQRLIEEVDKAGKPLVGGLKAAPVVETVVEVATEPPPPPPPPPIEPAPEPEPEPAPEPEPEPEPEPVLDEAEELEESDESVSDSSSDGSSRRGRRRNKR